MLSGNVFTVIINIVIVKALTNKFSTADYGIYALIISFTAFFQLVLLAPVAAAIFPFINEKKENGDYEDFQKEIFDMFIFLVSFLFLICIIVLIINSFISIIPDYWIYFSFVTILFSSTLSWLATLDTFSLANSKIKEYIVLPIINLMIKLIAIVVLYRTNITPERLIFIFSLTQLIWGYLEFKYLKIKGIITCQYKVSLRNLCMFNSPGKREIITYAKNFSLWGIFAWGQTFFDKWFLNHYVGSSTVAIYAVYYQYGFYPFTIFSSLISQYITPIYFSKIGDSQSASSFLKKILTYCIFFMILSCILAEVFAYRLAPFFIRILTNANYLEYIKLFPIIILAGCFYGYGQIITVPLLNSDFVSKVRFPKIGAAILAIALFWCFAPNWGLLGIVLALLISNLFYFITLLIINYKYLSKLKLQISNSVWFPENQQFEVRE